MMKTVFASALFAFCLFGQRAQGPLTDQRICDLVAAGVSAPEILRIIASALSVDFDLRPGSTTAIMNAGVSEEMIKAMAARENGGSVIPTTLKNGDFTDARFRYEHEHSAAATWLVIAARPSGSAER
jgi:hypothetical protein